MKSNQQVLIVLISICLGFSCEKKYQKTYINGTVTEYSSNLPIEHTTVILQSEDAKTIDSVYTDNEGRYSFLKKRKRESNMEF